MRISDWSSDVCSSDRDENAIGFRKNTGQQFMWIFNGFRSIFTTAKHRNVVHRSRTVEGDQRDNVTKVCWLYLSQRLAHSFRFQLRSEEHTSELQSLMRISYAVFCLKKKTINHTTLTQQLSCVHHLS